MRVNTTPRSDPRREGYELVLADARTKPFDWINQDCVRFAAAVVKARTDCDILADIPPWSTALEAARVIDSVGGLRAAFTRALGEPEAAGFARQGWVVLANDTDENGKTREVTTVCHGPYLLAPGPLGLAMLPLSAGICAWRVECL